MDEEREQLQGPALARAAAVFSRRPKFLGYWLDLYREAEGLEPVQLARHLGCTPEELLRVSVCSRPRKERLLEDIGALAIRFGVNGPRLADLLQDADLYAASGRGAPVPGERVLAADPIFAAASDREPCEDEGEDDGG